MIESLRGFIGTNQMMAYLVMMAVRLVELHRALEYREEFPVQDRAHVTGSDGRGNRFEDPVIRWGRQILSS